MPNLFGLPDITFANKDAAEIKRDIITKFETAFFDATGERLTLYPSDPRRLFLSTIADVIVLQRNLIDYVTKQNMLAFANGEPLEHLGLYMSVTRLPAQRAGVTIRFTLSAPQPGTMIIPAGTRVTPSGGNIYFSTDGNLEIPAGEMTGDVHATAMETGEQSNGFIAGQINRLVDPLPYIQNVTNTTTSEGGADIEDDENLRERTRLAPEGFSNAGSTGAYIFWARGASQLIADIGVYSPKPGVVNIFPLLADGEIPGQEILDAVLAACNADTVRPLTDLVQVLPPRKVKFNLNVTWHLERSSATKVIDITSKVNFAVQNWLVWQRSKLGRDINPSELISQMVQAGAKRVVVESPDFRVLEFDEVAVAASESVTYGGIEDG
ncbi:MAG: baseplate J/gp47 family protein [Synergistaceae bacterium]|jgi:phage-related baseplate assembly protein|nr:baseplate J/gp47 family protein [Synergistaceae bacterium]